MAGTLITNIYITTNFLHTSCYAAQCPDPADPVNGMVTVTGTSVGDTATYTCNPGFELIGSASATCTQVDVNSAAYSPAPPECRREYCMNITTCRISGVAACLLSCVNHTRTSAIKTLWKM